MTGFGPDRVRSPSSWRGPYAPTVATPAATTVALAMREVVERSPEVEAVVVPGGARWSYAELWSTAESIASGLRTRGVRPGDRVALRRGNDPIWCATFLAVLLLGGVVVPVNRRLTDEEAGWIAVDSGARVVIDDDDPPRGRPVTTVRAAADDDAAAIFYTSGTTGRPKGAVLTHRNLLAAAAVTASVLDLRPGLERNLVAAPLFHVMGSAVQWLPTWLCGGTTVLMPGFEAGAWIRAVAEEAVTVLTAVPAMYFLALARPEIADVDLGRVAHVGYGSAPTPPAQVRRLLEAFPRARLAPGYGLTESSGVATSVPHDDVVRLAHAVGYASPGTRVGLLDPREEDGGEVGELLVNRPQVMAGYHGNRAATDAALHDGWLRTGDVARVTPDGAVALLDRRSDMISRGGENVYCVEVERALAAHPDVAEVAVVGVADDALGHKVGAVVVPRGGRRPSPAELVDAAAPALADFKRPQYVVVTGEPLPRTRGGKVDKDALRRRTDWTSVPRRPRQR